MPCAICGKIDVVVMHHVRHVRKSSYKHIPDTATFEKVMALRNRKQIPICFYCHRSHVHGGKYTGPSLSSLLPKTKLVDNRIVHIESYVKPGVVVHVKSLEEKGWIKIKDPKQDINKINMASKKYSIPEVIPIPPI